MLLRKQKHIHPLRQNFTKRLLPPEKRAHLSSPLLVPRLTTSSAKLLQDHHSVTTPWIIGPVSFGSFIIESNVIEFNRPEVSEAGGGLAGPSGAPNQHNCEHT